MAQTSERKWETTRKSWDIPGEHEIERETQSSKAFCGHRFPCSAFFDVVKFQRVAGQRRWYGTKSFTDIKALAWGEIMFVRPPVGPSFHPKASQKGRKGQCKSQPKDQPKGQPEGQPEVSES